MFDADGSRTISITEMKVRRKERSGSREPSVLRFLGVDVTMFEKKASNVYGYRARVRSVYHLVKLRRFKRDNQHCVRESYSLHISSRELTQELQSQG